MRTSRDLSKYAGCWSSLWNMRGYCLSASARDVLHTCKMEGIGAIAMHCVKLVSSFLVVPSSRLKFLGLHSISRGPIPEIASAQTLSCNSFGKSSNLWNMFLKQRLARGLLEIARPRCDWSSGRALPTCQLRDELYKALEASDPTKSIITLLVINSKSMNDL